MPYFLTKPFELCFFNKPLTNNFGHIIGREERADDTAEKCDCKPFYCWIAKDDQHDSRNGRCDVRIDERAKTCVVTTVKGLFLIETRAHFFSNAFIDDNVSIDRNCHGEHDTRNTRKCECCAKKRHKGKDQ